jgi:aminopeptidase N
MSGGATEIPKRLRRRLSLGLRGLLLLTLVLGIRTWLAPSIHLANVGAANAQKPEAKESVERLKADVYYLSSVTLEGRGLATPGIELAAQHIRAEFRRIGLKSGPGDGSYYQPFEFRPTPDASPTTLKNVIGVLEGEGDLAGQALVIGAHYDHLGLGLFGPGASATPRSRAYPGADDNASGVAAMLELARRFALRATPPRRRLVFVAFSAEEAGLVGSRHYVAEAAITPIKDTVAMVNLDMVGRLRQGRLGIAGDGTAREFAGLLSEADAGSPLDLMLGGAEYPGDSDHAPFAAAGVPILYVCTGSHQDRHTPSDTAEKVNFEGLAEVVNLCEDVLGRLLVSPRPTFLPAKRGPDRKPE